MLFIPYLNPIFWAFGALALIASPFGWLFVLLTVLLFSVAKRVAYGESGATWAVGLFLAAFWSAHLVSERTPTIDIYPCGRSQGVEGGCLVSSTAGFPFPSLQYFPAGDVPHVGMWPMFFVNAFLFAAVALLIARYLPSRIRNQRIPRKLVLAVGIVLMLAGEAVIMLRFD